MNKLSRGLGIFSRGCRIFLRVRWWWGLRWLAGYLGLALVFVSGGGVWFSVFRGFTASGPWAVILSDLGTFLIFCNFLRS